MDPRSLANLVAAMLVREREKHLGILILAVVLVFLAASVLLLSGALRHEMELALDGQPDAVVQRMHAGRPVDLPVAWADQFAALPGVSAAQGRVFGRYFQEQNGVYFTVVGIDFFAENVGKELEALVAGLDVREFLDGDRMLVGSRVAGFLERGRYGGVYEFRTPEGDPVPVTVHGTLPEETDLVGADLVLVEIGLARRILGLGPDEATDIALSIPNDTEADAVMARIIGTHFDLRVLLRREMSAGYADSFRLRSGLFLLLGGAVLAAFGLVLFQRYSLITGTDRGQIGVLRATGWSVRQIIVLKTSESLVVGLLAYLIGAVGAVVYVHAAGAPGLMGLFLGFENLGAGAGPLHWIDTDALVLLFLFYLLPFTASVLVPTWRLANLDPVEVLR